MMLFISDIIPKIKQYSEKLDNLTLLSNQHWVVLDEIENSKLVYIFRSNNELLISKNGNINKGKWEYLGNNALMIEEADKSFLFKHGFFDESVLALKKDGVEDYAILINENKYGREINNANDAVSFLSNKYIEKLPNSISKNLITTKEDQKSIRFMVTYKTDKGNIIIDQKFDRGSPEINEKVYQNDEPAKDGKYRIGFMWYIHIKEGKVVETTII